MVGERRELISRGNQSEQWHFLPVPGGGAARRRMLTPPPVTRTRGPLPAAVGERALRRWRVVGKRQEAGGGRRTLRTQPPFTRRSRATAASPAAAAVAPARAGRT